MTAVNDGDEKYILQFDTAQHYDFIIRDKGGRELYRTSSDKIYTQQPSSVLVNRKEKLVYEEELFSLTNQAIHLPAGEYQLVGRITTKTPISVEALFRVAP